MSKSNGHAVVITSPEQEVTHAYKPRNPAQPWGLCACGYAQAAHVASAAPYVPMAPRVEE